MSKTKTAILDRERLQSLAVPLEKAWCDEGGFQSGTSTTAVVFLTDLEELLRPFVAPEPGDEADECGLQFGPEHDSGELEVHLTINGIKGSVFLSKEMWEEAGKKMGWTGPVRRQKKEKA